MNARFSRWALRLIFAASCLLLRGCVDPQPAFAQVPTGYVTVSAAHLQDSTGAVVANATISFAPVSSTNGQPISFRVGSGGQGQAISLPVTATVTNGAFTITLADTAVTDPANVCYSVGAVDNVTGNSLLSQGYGCVQPTAASSGAAYTANSYWCAYQTASCDFDNYIPNLAPNLTVQAGPIGPGFRYRGAWQASTFYAAMDVFSYSGTTYEVSTPYTSGTTFSATGLNVWSAGVTPLMDPIAVTSYGAVGDGATDDTAAWRAAIAAATAISQASALNLAPEIVVPATAAGYLISGELRIPANLVVRGSGSSASLIKMAPAIGSANLFTVLPVVLSTYYPQPLSWGHGGLYDLGIYGAGAASTGTAVEIDAAVEYHIDNVVIAEHGGRGITDVRAERTHIEGTNIYTTRKPITFFRDANEIVIENSNVVFPGEVDAVGTSPATSYSINAQNGAGLPPCPWSQGYLATCTSTSGTPTPLLPDTAHAAVTISGSDEIKIDRSSLKGVGGMPFLKIEQGTVYADRLYLEQSNTSAPLVAGGAINYATTTAAMTASSYDVPVNNIDWQTEYFGSCSDAVNATEPGWNAGIFPPDYLPNSTAASSLGGGFLRGQYEIVTLTGWCKDASRNPWFYAGSGAGYNGRNIGGCDNPPSCTASAALAWPAGSVIGRQPGAINLTVSHSHINGVNDPAAGFAMQVDDTTSRSWGDAIFGFIPDGYWVPQSANVPQVRVALTDLEMYYDATPGGSREPATGGILAHTNAVINFVNSFQGPLPPTTLDNADTIANNSQDFIFGFRDVRQIVYPNGFAAQLTVTDPTNGRFWDATSGTSAEAIASVDASSLYHLGLAYEGDYNFWAKPFHAPTPALTPSATGGSIPAGNWSVKIAYIYASAANPSDLQTGSILQGNVAVTNPGSGYSCGGYATISACPGYFAHANLPVGGSTIDGLLVLAPTQDGICSASPGATYTISSGAGTFANCAGDTGTGFAATLTVIGSYGFASLPKVVSTTGATSQIAVASPMADAVSGSPVGYNVYAGPLGREQLQNTSPIPIGTGYTIASLSAAPLYSSAHPFAPADCQYNCGPIAQMRFWDNSTPAAESNGFTFSSMHYGSQTMTPVFEATNAGVYDLLLTPSGNPLCIGTGGLLTNSTSVCNASSGGVASVAGSGALFSSGTTTGSVNLDTKLAAQGANLIFAGPSSGPAAAPLFRTLVNADIPSSLALPSGVTAATQAPTDSSALLATDAMVQTAIANSYAQQCASTVSGVTSVPASGIMCIDGAAASGTVNSIPYFTQYDYAHALCAAYVAAGHGNCHMVGSARVYNSETPVVDPQGTNGTTIDYYGMGPGIQVTRQMAFRTNNPVPLPTSGGSSGTVIRAIASMPQSVISNPVVSPSQQAPAQYINIGIDNTLGLAQGSIYFSGTNQAKLDNVIASDQSWGNWGTVEMGNNLLSGGTNSDTNSAFLYTTRGSLNTAQTRAAHFKSYPVTGSNGLVINSVNCTGSGAGNCTIGLPAATTATIASGTVFTFADTGLEELSSAASFLAPVYAYGLPGAPVTGTVYTTASAGASSLTMTIATATNTGGTIAINDAMSAAAAVGPITAVLIGPNNVAAAQAASDTVLYWKGYNLANSLPFPCGTTGVSTPPIGYPVVSGGVVNAIVDPASQQWSTYNGFKVGDTVTFNGGTGGALTVSAIYQNLNTLTNYASTSTVGSHTFVTFTVPTWSSTPAVGSLITFSRDVVVGGTSIFAGGYYGAGNTGLVLPITAATSTSFTVMWDGASVLSSGGGAASGDVGFITTSTSPSGAIAAFTPGSVNSPSGTGYAGSYVWPSLQSSAASYTSTGTSSTGIVTIQEAAGYTASYAVGQWITFDVNFLPIQLAGGTYQITAVNNTANTFSVYEPHIGTVSSPVTATGTAAVLATGNPLTASATSGAGNISGLSFDVQAWGTPVSVTLVSGGANCAPASTYAGLANPSLGQSDIHSQAQSDSHFLDLDPQGDVAAEIWIDNSGGNEFLDTHPNANGSGHWGVRDTHGAQNWGYLNVDTLSDGAYDLECSGCTKVKIDLLTPFENGTKSPIPGYINFLQRSPTNSQFAITHNSCANSTTQTEAEGGYVPWMGPAGPVAYFANTTNWLGDVQECQATSVPFPTEVFDPSNSSIAFGGGVMTMPSTATVPLTINPTGALISQFIGIGGNRGFFGTDSRGGGYAALAGGSGKGVGLESNSTSASTSTLYFFCDIDQNCGVGTSSGTPVYSGTDLLIFNGQRGDILTKGNITAASFGQNFSGVYTGSWNSGTSASQITISPAPSNYAITPNMAVYDTTTSSNLPAAFVGSTYVAGSATVPLVSTVGGSAVALTNTVAGDALQFVSTNVNVVNGDTQGLVGSPLAVHDETRGSAGIPATFYCDNQTASGSCSMFLGFSQSTGKSLSLTYTPGATPTTTGTASLSLNGTPFLLGDVSGDATFGAHLNQNASKNYAGVCAMSSGTTCTWTMNAATYSNNPVCVATEQSASATVIAASCSVNISTGVVTITAASSNSATWGAALFGNPN